MSDSVDRVFVHALNTVKKIPRTGSARPPPADRLRLYGLYKQSMEGDVDGVMDRPEGEGEEIHAEQDKWDARELVSELEFVWDQIKSNVPSSSSSSPVHALEAPPPPYPSFSGQRDPNGSGMRVLSPMSQGHEEDEGDEFDDAIEGEYEDGHDGEDDEEHPARPRVASRPSEARSRKWRRRVELALVKMTAEVAALREQIETRRVAESRRRSRFWLWIFWALWIAIRHVVVNAIFLSLVVWWMRQTKDNRLETVIRLLVEVGRDRLRSLKRYRYR